MLRVVLGNISDALIAGPDKPFKGQVIACRQWVVLIGFDQTTCIFSGTIIERIFFKYDLELTEVNRNWVLANYDAWVVFDILDLAEPSMRPDISSCEALRWICIKNSLHKVAAVITDEFGD